RRPNFPAAALSNRDVHRPALPTAAASPGGVIAMSPPRTASVPRTRSRILREMLNSPRDARIGIVNPTTARVVRDGRVIKFCQAKPHMTEVLRARRTRDGEPA